MDPKGSLSLSQEPTITCPFPETDKSVHDPHYLYFTPVLHFHIT